MKRSFPGYYIPNESEFRSLWQEALVALDASVLLGLYRYRPEPRKQFLRSLESLSGRLWMPHQAGLEFQRHRIDVIRGQRGMYRALTKILESSEAEIQKKRKELERHPVLEPTKLLERVAEAFTDLRSYLAEAESSHPQFMDEADPLGSDEVRDSLGRLFEGAVGPPYALERLEEIYREGAVRFDRRVPPGFLDARNKDDVRRYGDYVLWLQLMDRAREVGRSLIFVTDDQKDDWWWNPTAALRVPHPDLVGEFERQAGHVFWMYLPEDFLAASAKYLGQEVSPETLREVEESRLPTETSPAMRLRPYLEGMVGELHAAIQAELWRKSAEEEGRVDESAAAARDSESALERALYYQQALNERLRALSGDWSIGQQPFPSLLNNLQHMALYHRIAMNSSDWQERMSALQGLLVTARDVLDDLPLRERS